MSSKRVSARRGLIRQGDVLLVPVNGLPETTSHRRETVERVDGRLVLAEGEATGHAHTIEGPGARLLSIGHRPGPWGRPAMRTYLVVTRPQTLRHEEHDPLSVDRGVYEVRRQREYRPDRSVWVAD